MLGSMMGPEHRPASAGGQGEGRPWLDERGAGAVQAASRCKQARRQQVVQEAGGAGRLAQAALA